MKVVYFIFIALVMSHAFAQNEDFSTQKEKMIKNLNEKIRLHEQAKQCAEMAKDESNLKKCRMELAQQRRKAKKEKVERKKEFRKSRKKENMQD